MDGQEWYVRDVSNFHRVAQDSESPTSSFSLTKNCDHLFPHYLKTA